MKTLKQHVTEQFKAETKEEQFEVVEDELKCVLCEEVSDHRWYTWNRCVVEVTIDNVVRYFEYDVMESKGEDGNRYDCGFEVPDLDELVEVIPFERNIVDYKPL